MVDNCYYHLYARRVIRVIAGTLGIKAMRYNSSRERIFILAGYSRTAYIIFTKGLN
jgi:hypothetical protein